MDFDVKKKKKKKKEKHHETYLLFSSSGISYSDILCMCVCTVKFYKHVSYQCTYIYMNAILVFWFFKIFVLLFYRFCTMLLIMGVLDLRILELHIRYLGS